MSAAKISEVEEITASLLIRLKCRPAYAPLKVEMPEDHSLVEAARGGDREAFARLYELYAPMVHGILLSRVPAAEVDDLVHDVFLVALKRMHTLQDSRAFGSWLMMIARHRATDFHRRWRTVNELPEDRAGNTSSEADAHAANVLAMIRTLPEAYRETLILRLVEGMTGPEISTRTGLTPASVRVNLHRGMKLLRARLGVEERK
jgi:RNA polymerase sigma-70 factor (ECF subfamily)